MYVCVCMCVCVCVCMCVYVCVRCVREKDNCHMVMEGCMANILVHSNELLSSSSNQAEALVAPVGTITR